jgi:DNA-binding transcriptional LysR family regulator
MELRHIRYFLAAAEEMNITRAAVRLGIAQPPLTQQIKALEKELGVQLFNRVGRRIELTQSGAVLLDAVRDILERVDHAITLTQQAGHGDFGFLRVGFTGSAAFNPAVTAVLCEYRSAWPGVKLILEQSRTSELLEGLERGRLDVAFVRPNCESNAAISISFFSQEALVVGVPISHPLASRKFVTLEALSNEPFIFYPRSKGQGLSERVLAECARAGFTPVIAQESPQTTSTINLVAGSIGVAVVPECLRHLRPDSVRFLNLRDCELRAELQLARRVSDSSATVRHFVEIADRVGKSSGTCAA